MSKIVFYTNPASRGRIARWMLEEVGAPYETVLLEFAQMKEPPYLAVNPMGKVPTVVHRGRVVSEAAAICAYLAEAFPEAGLAPTADERADYYRWMFFMAGPAEAAVTDFIMGVVPGEQHQRIVGYGTYDRMVEVLEHAASQHPYIAGDRFTAADVYFGAQILAGTQYENLPDRPGFAAYKERLVGRPAYQRAKAIDDKLMWAAA